MLNNLGKMMKYEFKAVGKTLLPLYAAFLVLSIPADITMLTGDLGGVFFSILLIVAGFGVFVAAVVMTFLILIQRFSRNIYGDQGYLTMTLPVSTHTQIMTKTLSAVIWSVIFTLFFLLTAVISVLILNGKTENFLSDFICEVGANLNAGTFLLALLSELFGSAALALKAYASISVGHLFPKNHKVAGIISFVAFSLVQSFIMDLLDHIGLFESLEDTSLTIGGEVIATGGMGFSGIPELVWQMLMCVIFYAVTWYLVDRKLNLQ